MHPIIASYFAAIIIQLVKPLIVPPAKRMLQPSLQKKLERDKRKPVLLLRSFKWDNTKINNDFNWGKITFEEELVKTLDKYGPVITLGSPKDLLRPVGAARSYVSGDRDRWTKVVKDLLSMAQLYVAILDFTESLEWELDYIKSNSLLHKLVIIFPWWLLESKERQRWIDSYTEARDRLIFLPPFKKSILGVWCKGTGKIILNEETDNTDRHMEQLTEFLGGEFSRVLSGSRAEG